MSEHELSKPGQRFAAGTAGNDVDVVIPQPVPPFSSASDDMSQGTFMPFRESTYRRTITLQPGPGAIHAEMEDYIHHFAVDLAHDDTVVTEASAVGIRHPWDACPGGARGVARLVGTPLADAGDRHGWADEVWTQCVHVVDLAKLASRHALDTEPTDYEMVIPRASASRRTATMRRNGNVLFTWDLRGRSVTGPDRFEGLDLAGGAFFRWVDEHAVDVDEAEAFIVMRRAVHIGMSRGIDLDRYALAAHGSAVNNSCFVFQPAVAVTAHRMVGSSRPTEQDVTIT